MRCTQTAPATAGFLLTTLVFMALWNEVPTARVVAWLFPLLVGLAVRLGLARSIVRGVDEMALEELSKADRTLRLSSIANQALVGAGIWIIGAAGSHDADLFVTFAIMLYAIGAMVNLSSDFRSFRLSLPLLLIQPIIYWSMQDEGVRIAIPLLVLGALMLTAVRSSSRTFADSVAIRLEKNALLEKIRAENENTRRALEIAEQANRSKAAFMAAASHDLRQPLFAIGVLAETLDMHELPDAAHNVLAKQLHAIAVLRSLFDNLLDLSKFETGKVQVACEAVSLSRVLEPLDNEFSTVCEAKGLQWRFSGSSASVYTDPELLRRLLCNLLANAAKYTAHGYVSLRAEVQGRRVKIEIADSGPGIAAADHERIFQEFVQLQNPHRDRDMGVGLGLTIVRRIDALLQAGLEMHSEVGKGTRFSLCIPLADAVAPVVTVVPSGASAQAAPPTLNIWLVEDDPLVRSALGLQFDAWRCPNKAAMSREELYALRESEGRWPDAVILDDMLGPRESGLDIARSLQGELSRERILIITANIEPERLALLEGSGFAVMRKPVASEALRQWLSAVAAKQVA
jgi:signal transduction histidine kinase